MVFCNGHKTANFRGIRRVCQIFKDKVEERFGDFWYTAVGGFFFLRYICPALIVPKAFDVMDGRKSGKFR